MESQVNLASGEDDSRIGQEDHRFEVFPGNLSKEMYRSGVTSEAKSNTQTSLTMPVEPLIELTFRNYTPSSGSGLDEVSVTLGVEHFKEASILE
jgi:hypothetical protein